MRVTLQLVLGSDGPAPLHCRFKQEIARVDVDEPRNLGTQLLHQRHCARKPALLVRRAAAGDELPRGAGRENEGGLVARRRLSRIRPRLRGHWFASRGDRQDRGRHFQSDLPHGDVLAWRGSLRNSATVARGTHQG